MGVLVELKVMGKKKEFDPRKYMELAIEIMKKSIKV